MNSHMPRRAYYYVWVHSASKFTTTNAIVGRENTPEMQRQVKPTFENKNKDKRRKRSTLTIDKKPSY
jgi:hypothetical protein